MVDFANDIDALAISYIYFSRGAGGNCEGFLLSLFEKKHEMIFVLTSNKITSKGLVYFWSKTNNKFLKRCY